MSSAEKTGGPRTSIVVINWNRRALLEQCLRSIEQQTERDFELILIDNGSTDGSLDVLKHFSFPALQVIRNTENRGYTPAVNQGIRAARGRFIALINNDVVLATNWLAEALSGFARDAQIGMCASKILLALEPGRIDKVGHLLYPDGQNYGRGHRELDRGQYDRVEEVLWPDGATAIYRVELFETSGLFDEDFFAYGDDAELGLRAQLCGWKCLYLPAAVSQHHHSATLGPYSPAKIFLVERNRIWLALKLFPWPHLLAVPVYTAVRFAYSLGALLARRGDVGRSTREGSVWGLVGAVLRAQWAAFVTLPRMLAKRRDVARHRKISTPEFTHLIRRYSISARRLTFHD